MTTISNEDDEWENALRTVNPDISTSKSNSKSEKKAVILSQKPSSSATTNNPKLPPAATPKPLSAANPKPPPATTPVINFLNAEKDRINKVEMPSSVAISAIVATQHDSSIDPTLLDAIGNPRERLTALKYEDRIMRFVKTTQHCLEIPPLANSYQRLLVYRIAQRFKLDHAVSTASPNTVSESEKGVVLFRTSTTVIPRVLLIDLAKDMTDKQDCSTTNSNVSATPVVKVMKRDRLKSANDLNKQDANSGKPQVTASQREKAYAEARARIFGEELAEKEKDGASSPPRVSSSGSPSTTKKISSSDSLEKVASKSTFEKTGSSSSVSSLTGAITTPTGGSSRTVDETRTPSPSMSNTDVDPITPQDSMKRSASISKSNKEKKVVDAGQWKGKKSTTRNKDLEKNDPDFARHTPPSVSYPVPMPYQTQPTQQFVPPPPNMYSMGGGMVLNPNVTMNMGMGMGMNHQYADLQQRFQQMHLHPNPHMDMGMGPGMGPGPSNMQGNMSSYPMMHDPNQYPNSGPPRNMAPQLQIQMPGANLNTWSSARQSNAPMPPPPQQPVMGMGNMGHRNGNTMMSYPISGPGPIPQAHMNGMDMYDNGRDLNHNASGPYYVPMDAPGSYSDSRQRGYMMGADQGGFNMYDATPVVNSGMPIPPNYGRGAQGTAYPMSVHPGQGMMSGTRQPPPPPPPQPMMMPMRRDGPTSVSGPSTGSSSGPSLVPPPSSQKYNMEFPPLG